MANNLNQEKFNSINQRLIIDPDNQKLLMQRGHMNLNFNFFAAAIDDFLSVITKQKNNVEALLGLLKAYSKLGETKQVSSTAQKILRFDPLNKPAYLHLIDIARQNNDLEQAQQLCDRYLTNLPDDEAVNFRKGIVLRQKKHFSDSIMVLHQLLTINPEFVPAQMQLALTYLDMGEFQQALTYFLLIPDSHKQKETAYLHIVECFIAQKNWLEALEYLEKGLALYPLNSQFVNKKARVYRLQGRLAELSTLLAYDQISLNQKQSILFNLVLNAKAKWDINNVSHWLNKLKESSGSTSDDSIFYVKALLALNKADEAFKVASRFVKDLPSEHPLIILKQQAEQQYRPMEIDLNLNAPSQNEDEVVFAFDAFLLRGDVFQAYQLLHEFIDTGKTKGLSLSRYLAFLMALKLYDKATAFLFKFKHCMHLFNRHLVDSVVHIHFTLGNKEALCKLLHMFSHDITQLFFPKVLWVLVASGAHKEALEYYHRIYPPSEDNKKQRAEFLVSRIHAQALPRHSLSKQCETDILTAKYLQELFFQPTDSIEKINPVDLFSSWNVGQKKETQYYDWYRQVCRSEMRHRFINNLVDKDYLTIQNVVKHFPYVDLTELEELQKKRQSFLLVSSHLGVPGIMPYFVKYISRLLYLVSHLYPVNKGNPITDCAFSIDGSVNSLKTLKLKIKQGYSVIGAIDQLPELTSSGQLQSIFKEKVGGIEIEFSTLLPRLIWAHSLPSFWTQALYENGQIVIRLIKLPCIQEFSDRKSWQAAWFNVCASQLEGIINSSPENHAPFAPFWKQMFAAKFKHVAEKINAFPLPLSDESVNHG
jgi:tetratricopeptide (TPR) repeat protein